MSEWHWARIEHGASVARKEGDKIRWMGAGLSNEEAQEIADYLNNLEAENRRLRTALEAVIENADLHAAEAGAIGCECLAAEEAASLARAALEPQPQAEGAPGASERTRE